MYFVHHKVVFFFFWATELFYLINKSTIEAKYIYVRDVTLRNVAIFPKISIMGSVLFQQ
jgi:hypothetical protein